MYFDGTSRVKSDYSFGSDVTFFFLAKRTSKGGRLFTSSTSNSVLGWWDTYQKLLWIEGELMTTRDFTTGDNKIHLWIMTLKNTPAGFDFSLYDGDKLIIENNVRFPRELRIVTWNQVTIGLPVLFSNEAGTGHVYECLCFDSMLDKNLINTIKLFIKKYYKYE
jgi:hypothetical protein